MHAFRPAPRDRAISALLSATLVALLGWLLVVGLGVRVPGVSERALDVFEVAPPLPPPPVRITPAPTRNRRPEGEAAPPNLRSTATPIVAPVPIVVVRLPSPVIAAPVAGPGSDPSQGAAAAVGPGTGAGGQGNGTGSGGNGDGDGDGDGGGWRDETPPRWRRGRIRDSDYPEEAEGAAASGLVSVRCVVEIDERLSNCRIEKSSGNAALDRTTVRLVGERFRYRPWRDSQGRPGRSVMSVEHIWATEAIPDDSVG
ncbi:TonB family protein [uncultured Sphingomonas sp.]|uniref:TonB family protein n=1 Tax=uncultured Sphingomonas sp. TaxID=158754 RepID=UPI0035CA12CF